MTSPAVGLERIVREIFLVIIFGQVELVERGHLGHDGVVPNACCADLLDDLLGDLLLLLIVIEDGRAVLRAHVRALAVERGRVVDGKEDRQQVVV